MITCYTDGSALTNPGPAGRARVTVDESNTMIASGTGGVPYATNNQMELQAVIAFLESQTGSMSQGDTGTGLFSDLVSKNQESKGIDDEIVIITDSTYVQMGVIQRLDTRVRRDRRRSKGGKKIANMDQRIILHRLIHQFTNLTRKRTKAHVGTQWNEWVDEAARTQAQKFQSGRDL